MPRSLRPGRGQNSRRQMAVELGETKVARVSDKNLNESSRDPPNDSSYHPDVDANSDTGGDESEASEETDKTVQAAPFEELSDKVRQSAARGLCQLFSSKLVPRAVERGLLTADTDVSQHSEKLATEIEAALYDQYAIKPANRTRGKSVDVGQKYRDRFRTVSFNLRDDKNSTLQEHIVTREITPEELAKLSPEEMLNPELRELAAEVRKESIRDSVLKNDDGAPRVRKTHKGEELVEQDSGSVAPVELENIPEVSVPGTLTYRQLGDVPPSNEADVEPVDHAYYPTASASYADYDLDNAEAEAEPTLGSSPRDENQGKEPELRPVWEGPFKLGSSTVINFEAVAFGSNDLSADIWQAVVKTGEPLRLTGKSNEDTVKHYIERIVGKATVATWSLVSDNNAPVLQLSQRLHRGSAVGVLQHSLVVKDAFLVPLNPSREPPSWLPLSSEAREIVQSLSRDHCVLIGVYILPKF